MSGMLGKAGLHQAVIAVLGLVAMALLGGFYVVVSDAVEGSAVRRLDQSAAVTATRRHATMLAPRLALAGSSGSVD